MSSQRPTSFMEGVSEVDDSPDVQHSTLWGDVWIRLKRDKRFWIAAVLIAIFVVMAILPQVFLTKDPHACPIADSALRPGRQHWFGTDILGCDYYTRLIYGARTSLEVGLVVSSLTILIALTLGSSAGYFGGKTDMIISRFADIWFSVPTILGAILVLTLFHGAGRSSSVS